MTTQEFKIDTITIAITNISEMVNFYETVFNCGFTEIEAYGTTLFSGNLAGIKILLCPNEVACVNAEKNRHQFDFLVTNLDNVICLAQASNGTLSGDIIKSADKKAVTIIDPDGNTMNFIQKI